MPGERVLRHLLLLPPDQWVDLDPVVGLRAHGCGKLKTGNDND